MTGGPDDLLPPGPTPAPAPAPAPPRRATGVDCEFCGCRLDTAGNVLQRGDAARTYLDLEDKLAKAKESLDKANASITELRGQLEAATAVPARRGALDDL